MTNGQHVPRTGHPVRKRILYFAPSRAHSDSLFGVLGSVPGAVRARENGGTAFHFDDVTLRFVLRQDAVEAHEALHHGYYNAVVLDLRTMSGRSTRLEEHFEKTMRLLDLMDAEPDIELRYGFHRILALISGRDSAQVDDLIRRLGSRGIGHVLRDPSVCYLDSSCSRLPAPAKFGKLVVDELVRMTTAGKKGSRALCASGGGITGLYFEMGALKCLADCLPPGALNAFDMYFGISAGAVLSGILANGYSIDEFMASIAGHPCARVPNVDLSLLKVAHVNLASLAMPFENALRGFATTLSDVVRGKANPSFSSLFLDYSDLLTAPFQADGYEAMLRYLFTQPGATNDFRKLHRRLFIGATDQDAREHVLFGEPGFDNVPVSKAIQASLSINPAFASTKIGERYYVDGAVHADLQLHRGDPQGRRPDLRPGSARAVRLEGSRRLRQPPRPPLQRRPGHPDGILHTLRDDPSLGPAPAPRRQHVHLPPGEPSPKGALGQPDGPPPLPRHLAGGLSLDSPADPPPPPPDVRRPRDPRAGTRHVPSRSRRGPARGRTTVGSRTSSPTARSRSCRE